MNLESFIDLKAKEVAPIEKTNREAWWNLATTGKSEFADELSQTALAIRQAFSSKSDYAFLRDNQVKHDNNSSWGRQAKLLLDLYTENQISVELMEKIIHLETEIESLYTNFRPKIDEDILSNNELKTILRDSTDSEKRKRAWEASKEIGVQVEKKVLELISLRNEAARQVGFDNYYSMRLSLQELDEEKLFLQIEALDSQLTPLWDEYKATLDEKLCERMAIVHAELMPWHYQDPFFQEAPTTDVNLNAYYKGQDIVEISRLFYQHLGLPVEDVLNRSDLFERQGKSQHAFCVCLDRSKDVRILCNIQDNESWMATQLHELGHAVYDLGIGEELPYFLKEPAHICTTEAVAMLFGRFSKHPLFLKQYGNGTELDENLLKKSGHSTAAGLLVFSRWALVMIYFERAMYQQPQCDLNNLWWDYVERFQKVMRVSDRNLPDWASKLHLACAPVYYQNYLLGEMIASQLLNTFWKKNGSSVQLPDKKVGKWLKTDFFASGKRYSWEETLFLATQEYLNAHYFVNDIKEKLFEK